MAPTNFPRYQQQNGEERKKPTARKTVDYGSSIAKWMYEKYLHRNQFDKGSLIRTEPNHISNLLPPAAYLDNPATSLMTKFVHTSMNKIKHPVNVVKWTPEGRRLITASSSGEFTLWNGMSFNFDTILQAHESAIRACEWSHNGEWLLSGDHSGIIKYWQPNMNNVKAFNAHDMEVRALAFCPSDSKFVTASDDKTLKIWNFDEGIEERTLIGHGWDAKAVDWHPSKGLLVSGSKDNLVKFWDPRSAKCISTLHGHKNTVTATKFQPTQGNLLATCARDATARIFDIRAMKDLRVLRGHEKDVWSLAWHPIHTSLISTGGGEGRICHYLLDELSQDNPTSSQASPTIKIPFAHEQTVSSLQYHPLGHILCSGSTDRATRFWTRARPGDPMALTDRFHIGEAAAKEKHGDAYSRRNRNLETNEEDDEANALIDQQMPPGHHLNIPPPPTTFVPGLTNLFPANMPFPFPPQQMGGLPTPLPPGLGFPHGMAPFLLPGFGNVPPPEIPGMGQVTTSSTRRRVPLPSQQELKSEFIKEDSQQPRRGARKGEKKGNKREHPYRRR
ncbi:Polyadenylation factor subunit 2 [Neolecta irregularis DAH-3]|uniref:Polyadenylation factor subunit 2 n=1 Tax=Neolecta irregularis (strain DAH-3) TaxID=1198029 RepID=A0A1U7LPU7_NEOID|nr:Polyadenylation factor subunit 2 [Neolecta irregularis DAH-3]|eukprot:OLL24659.1 Polyadenylation factor subunit 2 [Neolecta irregularis DAH-3]